jgi:UDP-GlcNAc:undecaprenyl-phosphate GlcNAc-1-phosphate transferase
MLAAGMIFVLIGFLPVNWNPSKVFMGDSGSQLLGLLLAALSIKLLWNNPVSNADEITRWISVIALFAVTLTDSLLVTINRLRHKKSPFVGGRDHSTHNLSYYSISDASIALIYTGWGLLQVILVWQLLKNPVDGFLKWEGFVLVWLVVIFISFYQISRTNLKRGKFKY